MISLRQIEANRRNARRSTGPMTEVGKQRSRCNAVRHGLTAKTAIGSLEDAEDYEDYRAFEAAIIVVTTRSQPRSETWWCDWRACCGGCAVPRQSKTGLFEIQADYLSVFKQSRQANPAGREVVYALFRRDEAIDFDRIMASRSVKNGAEAASGLVPRSSEPRSGEPAVDCR